jgi:hypothetical protein
MRRRAAIAALFLIAVLRAAPQQAPDAASGTLILKSASRAVQLDVFVNDAAGHPVHGLRKSDFVVTDNGHPRDVRIFSGEIDADRTAPSSAKTAPPPDMYSNRVGLLDSRIVTAIVIDAVPRPGGLQRNAGGFAPDRPDFSANIVLGPAISAINRMAPGQTIAIYAACPDLRVVQDYTSDPDRLIASLKAFVPVRAGADDCKKQPWTVDAFVPPLLSALRDVVGRMSGASGRKSVVWLSQAYFSDLDLRAIDGATGQTVAAFNDANVSLYAVDTRLNPVCQHPARLPGGLSEDGRNDRSPVVPISLTCSMPPDVGDDWMSYLAQSTGGRAFRTDSISATEFENAPLGSVARKYEFSSDHGIVSDAIRFAADDSRYAYQMGFYVPESELDGKVHVLSVTVPGKPKFELRYRGGYTASSAATAPPATQELPASGANEPPASPLNPDQVGIDAKVDLASKNELRVSLALAPETLTSTADGVILLDAAFVQTNDAGKQLAKVQETVRAPSPEAQTGMVRYSRAIKLANGAVLLRVTIRDQATNRVGSIAIPLEKR